MTDTLEELEKLLAEATEVGDWSADENTIWSNARGVPVADVRIGAPVWYRGPALPYQANAALIVAAINALPGLLESARRVETTAAQDVLAERERQKSAEGWTASHDDEYDEGQLPRAAAAYAISAATPGGVPALSASMFGCQLFPTLSNRNFLWPWETRFWKPKDPRRDLVRAGALILAEIERLDRAALKETP